MKKKNKGVTLSDVKGYYIDSVTETVWYWKRERHRAMDRIENLDIDPCKYTQLIFDKDTKGEPFQKKWFWSNWTPIGKIKGNLT